MIETLKQMPLILPIRKARYEMQFANHKVAHYFRGVFDTFEEACASAPKTKPTGYNNDESARMYKERLETIQSTDYPVLFWMEKLKNDFRTVFDFGGHIGIHYYSYPKLLDFKCIDEWTICDVEKVCKEGKLYSQMHPRNTRLNFVSDMNFCKGYDLLLAIGSLQYLEWELHDKLANLKDMPKYVIINMIPLHPKTKTITLNSIGTSFCPYYVRQESDFVDGMTSIGYELLDIWSNEEKKCTIAFEPERSLTFYRGAVFKLTQVKA